MHGCNACGVRCAPVVRPALARCVAVAQLGDRAPCVLAGPVSGLVRSAHVAAVGPPLWPLAGPVPGLARCAVAAPARRGVGLALGGLPAPGVPERLVEDVTHACTET